MNPEENTPREPGIRVDCGFGTDRGLRRELNEDSLVAMHPIYAIADGMGGHEAGEIASSICVQTLAESRIVGMAAPEANASDIQELIHLADQRIRYQTQGIAGTTLSGVVLVQESGQPYWLVFNVGDSRTYRLSQGTFAQITVDHSEVQELVDSGQITPDEALIHPRRHVVTRALGAGSDTEADFWLMPVEEGDRILVCSDGLTAEVSDDHIFRILSTLKSPQDATDSLIQAALRSGGRDNISVIVIDAADVTNERDVRTTAPRNGETAEDTLPRPGAGEAAAGATDTAPEEPERGSTYP